MGMTAVSVIAVCILLWFSIQHWDVVSAGTRKIVKILAPILCGAVLTYLTAPAYNWVAGIVEKTLGSVTKNSKYVRGAARMLATAACLGLVIVLVVGMFQLMIPQLIESLIGIQDSFPLYVQNVYEWIQRILKNNPEIENMVLSSFENNLAVFQNWAEKSFTNIDMHRIGQIVTGLSSSVLGVLEFIKNWLIGLIVMVYLLNIKDTLAAQGKKIVYGCLNLRQANLVIEELRFINQMFGGFIIGKLVDSLIIGIICFIGVTILNMPFPMLLSVIIGVTNVIPFFGPFIGAIPAAFLVFLVSPLQCVYFLIWILLLQQFDGNILGPKILGNSTGLSSFWVLFSILFFGGLFGFVGMIIAVPAFAVIYDLISRAVHRSLRLRKLPMETDEYRKLDHIDEKTGMFMELNKKWRFRLFWHSCSLQLYFWITRIMIFHAPWHRKLWRYHLQTGTTSLRRRENTEAILERRIRMNGMPNILTI